MAYEKQTWVDGEVITQEKLNHVEGGVEGMNTSYEKQTWVTGEVITADKLNHIEDGIANGSGSSGDVVYFGENGSMDSFSPGTVRDSVTEIYLSKNVKEVKNGAFGGFNKVKKVTIEGNTKINNYAFSGMSALETVIAPECTYIGSDAFSGCKVLTHVDIRNATSLGAQSFVNCSSLETISIPELTTVYDGTFMNTGITRLYAPKLKSLATHILKKTDPETGYDDTTARFKVFLPALEQYNYASPFNGQAEYLYIGANCTEINKNAFDSNNRGVLKLIECGFSEGACDNLPINTDVVIRYDVPIPPEDYEPNIPR